MPIKHTSKGSLSRELVDQVLLGPKNDRRFMQESPVLPEVWTAFGADPGGRVPLLITPYADFSAGYVATALRHSLNMSRAGAAPQHELSYIQHVVAATLDFSELVRVVLPLTEWWIEQCRQTLMSDRHGANFDDVLRLALGRVIADPDPPEQHIDVPTDVARLVGIVGLILICTERQDVGERLNSASGRREILEAAVQRLTEQKLWRELLVGVDEHMGHEHGPIFLVSANRTAYPAVSRSCHAVKADAARRLFDIKCKSITWAIVDSGIDAGHPAFLNDDRTNSRVQGVYDFTQVRELLRIDRLTDAKRRQELAVTVGRAASIPQSKALEYLATIEADVVAGRSVNWDVVKELLQRPRSLPPNGDHGTHVAGILGANWQRDGTSMTGMCPDIQLYDLRVLAPSIVETEFAVIAALQFIRHLNDHSGRMVIHGANLSLSIPHDIRNYACGRTPVCEEAERLAASGAVVVAAAGNRGFNEFLTTEGPYPGYSAISITDPGNADAIITVGATHRYRPHTYGVSYFSSRGPTGDGRSKPDLVAPGEKIEAPTPNGRYATKDGTSMAAPHVSGAAAMLMARHAELIGQPARIKEILCETATNLGRERHFQGAGMLDVLRALQRH